jgi:hypothetical protein
VDLLRNAATLPFTSSLTARQRMMIKMVIKTDDRRGDDESMRKRRRKKEKILSRTYSRTYQGRTLRWQEHFSALWRLYPVHVCVRSVLGVC